MAHSAFMLDSFGASCLSLMSAAFSDLITSLGWLLIMSHNELTTSFAIWGWLSSQYRLNQAQSNDVWIPAIRRCWMHIVTDSKSKMAYRTIGWFFSNIFAWAHEFHNYQREIGEAYRIFLALLRQKLLESLTVWLIGQMKLCRFCHFWWNYAKKKSSFVLSPPRHSR